MLSLHVPHRLPIFSQECDVAKGEFPYLHPEEAMYTTACNAHPLGQISCKTPDLQAFLDDAEGFDLMTVKAAQPVTAEGLPRFIPIVDRDFFDVTIDGSSIDTIGISLEDAFSSTANYHRGCYRIKNLHVPDRLLEHNLFQGKRVILMGSGRDALLESFWIDYLANGYCQKLQRQNFFMVTALNFSLFLGGCTLGQAHNLKRSLISFAEFQKAFLPAVPHLYWLNEYQLQRWITWLEANPIVQLVTINCQLYRKSEWAFVIEGIMRLHRTLGGNLHFLLEGPKIDFLKELQGISSCIHITEKWPSAYARVSRVKEYNGVKLREIRNSIESKSRILVNNLKACKAYLDDHFFEPENNLPQQFSYARDGITQSITSNLTSATVRMVKLPLTTPAGQTPK